MTITEIQAAAGAAVAFTEIPLIGGSYLGSSKYANPQRSINLFQESDRTGGRPILRGTPGLVTKIDLTESELSSEMIENGDFGDSDTDWTLDAQWSVTDGVLVRSAGSGDPEGDGNELIADGDFDDVEGDGNLPHSDEWSWSNISYRLHADSSPAALTCVCIGDLAFALNSDTFTPTAGQKYVIRFELYGCPDLDQPPKDWTSEYADSEESIRVTLGGVNSDYYNTDGAKVLTLEASTTAVFGFNGVADTGHDPARRLFIDNISVEVFSHYSSTGDDWAEQVADDLNGTIVEGRTYRLTFTVTGISGIILAYIGGETDNVPIRQAGTYTKDIVAGSGGGVGFWCPPDLNTEVNIDNVSMKEIKHPDNELRCMMVMGDYLYVVQGQKLKRIDEDWQETTLNSNRLISTKTGLVSMTYIWNLSGGKQLMICDGTTVAYLYDDTTEEFTVLDQVNYTFFGGGTVTSQDGFFISNQINSPDIYHSALNNGLSWDTTDLSRAEVKPTNTLRVFSWNRDLWVFKQESMEIFYNTGDADLVFKRRPGGNIEHGLGAVWAVAAIGNTILWLADDKTVRRGFGLDPRIVSTPQITSRIEALGDISDATSFAYSHEGHQFYVLNFPRGKLTLVYDLTENDWHERSSWWKTQGDMGRWRANCYAKFQNYHLVGDYENNKIYYLDSDVYTDDGNTIIRRRIMPNIGDDRRDIVVYGLEIEMEAGVGAVSGQGSAPAAMLKLSKDGGKSYPISRKTLIGPIGKTLWRCIWNRLGSAKTLGIDFSISDPIKTVIVGAYLRHAPGEQ